MTKANGRDTTGSTVENGENHIAEGSGTAQAQGTASTESWLGQVQSKSRSWHDKWKLSKNVCIYRVPKPMRTSKDNVYDPFVVSFGPFHYKMNTKLSSMDEHKLEALYRTSERIGMGVPDLIAHIRVSEDKIRDCYEEPIEWDSDTLSWAFAMDACFILEFLKGYTRTEKQNDLNCFSLVFQNHPQKNSMSYGILNDIMKMENQIPLFILISLLREEFKIDDMAERQLCLMLVTSRLFGGFPFRSSFACSENVEQEFDQLIIHIGQNPGGPAHLLDLYRMVIKDLVKPSPNEVGNINSSQRGCKWSIDMSCTSPTPSSDDRKSTPSAELLKTAGIKFERGRIGFRKRRFGKSTLFLPEIRVTDSTVTLLRNVMAYEECQRSSWDPQETVISHYLVLLDYLVDSAKDVSVLRKARVISSLPFSDKDIACRLNNINEGITVGTYDGFEKVMEKARKHYDSQWNVWISQFQEEHCSKPWYLVSLVAGILLLALTAVQAVYTVKN